MARPLRIEFADAVYHVTARGNRQEPIFLDDHDRRLFLDLLAQAFDRFDAGALAYCLMGNHYHLVLRTRQPNLSALMRHVNGVFTQRVNRRHGKVGHVFQGRFKAILVDRDAYLLEVCRYVDLNPVRAGMVASARDWPWSSYQALTGASPVPPWLDATLLHGMLLGHTPTTPADGVQAQRLYADLVAAAREVPLWPARCGSRSIWATRRSSNACKPTPPRYAWLPPKCRGHSAQSRQHLHCPTGWRDAVRARRRCTAPTAKAA